MPKKACVQCNTEHSSTWRALENGHICNECYTTNLGEMREAEYDLKYDPDYDLNESETQSKLDEEITPGKVSGKGYRKSTRATRYKTKTPGSQIKTNGPRGRGRRSIFKKQPLKAPTATATVVTSDSLFYKGIYMQVGDIVSMIDISGGTYYAQIRGFMTDEYCEKSAVVTWLLPTKASPPPHEKFDPATYIIGPDEELPRKLNYMEFVMHAPSDYYKSTKSPYPPSNKQLNCMNGFIWTSLEAQDR